MPPRMDAVSYEKTVEAIGERLSTGDSGGQPICVASLLHFVREWPNTGNGKLSYFAFALVTISDVWLPYVA